MFFRYNILLIFVSDLMSCLFLGIYSNYFHEGFMIVFPNWFNLPDLLPPDHFGRFWVLKHGLIQEPWMS